LAGRSKCVAVPYFHDRQRQNSEIQIDRQHFERRGATGMKMIPIFPLSVRWNKVPNAENLGNFEPLIDEELTSQTQDDSLTGKQRANNRWK
jgi:hypothetical protein